MAITTNTKHLKLLRLMSLMSPTLPIGGFSYSQGIEKAVEDRWIMDMDTSYEWLSGQLCCGFVYTDLPLLRMLYDACDSDNKDEAIKWSQTLLACRETSELRQEEINRGRALTKVIEELENSITDGWEHIIRTNYLSGLALIGNYWKIPISELLLGYSWSWLEHQVSAVVKIIPLGQTQGQQLLYRLVELVPDIIKQSMLLKEEEIGRSQPALAIASSLHETQYTRIFRS
jgi:urease accessory protein